MLRPRTLFALPTLFVLGAGLTGQAPERQTSAQGSQGAVSCGSEIAAAAGLEILKQGGNAADATVATLLVQTVVESGSFCFGGEIPIIVYNAERDVVEVLSGQGSAPRLATAKWFKENRDGVIRGRGDIANVTVPGALDACLTLLDRHGTMTFAQVAEPMLRILTAPQGDVTDATARPQRRQSRGRPPSWYPNLAKTMGRLLDAETQSPDDRSRGIRLVADYFYRGPIAWELDAWSRENGGLLRYPDLATHVTRVEDPLSIEFQGYTIYKCGFWTQGPALLQAMKLLDGLPLKEMGHNSPDYIHTVTEAMKLAFADRDTYYGDPLFVKMPKGLLSDEYANLRRELIDMNRASQIQQPGDPANGQAIMDIAPQDYRGAPMRDDDTTTCTVVDKWGNAVSTTPSGWGGVLAEDLGINLNSRMISLNVWDGHPSVVEPGKRPRVTLTPSLIMKDGAPALTISVAGGDQQDQCAIQILLNHIVFGFAPDQAVSAPRFSTRHLHNLFGHQPPRLGTLTVPTAIGEQAMANLRARGHKLDDGPGVVGRPSIILITTDGVRHAAGDPRARRSATAY